MKKTTKIFAVVLAILMTFAMTLTASAANGSITVDNPIEGQDYTAYKIFDVVYNDNGNYSYSIDSSSDWFATVKAYADVADNSLVLTPAASNANLYIVEINGNFVPASFAAALKDANVSATGTALTVADGKASATGLDLGYYFVTSTTGALCNLTTTDPTAVIHDKNDVPFTKVVDDANPEVGQVITFTVTGKVPSTTGFADFDYVISDTMTEGLTFDFASVTVTVGGAALAEDKYTLTEGTNGFELDIDVMNIQDKVAQDIVVTYSATVNEKAVGVISNNTAVLEYNNNPTSVETTQTLPIEVELYTSQIIIDKFAADDEETKLAGAEFVLYKEVEGVKSYYKYDAENDVVSWVADIADATVVVTDENGAATIIGLEDGEYKLQETKAPEGYNLLKSDVTITIDGSAATKADLSTLTVEADVANSTGLELPETGGIGTTIFYIVGGILVIGAAVLLITKKRMGTAK